jgi:tRNA U34 5-carboxymethylaminomethyl modifying GTPase MnmE/TrmE
VSIINDFFYLSWEREPVCTALSVQDNDHFQSLLKSDRESFCDALVIALSISAATAERLGALKETEEALIYCVGQRPETLGQEAIHAIQCRLLFFLIDQGDVALNKSIGQRLDRLRKEGIIGYDTSRKLISLLTLIEVKQAAETAMVERAPERAPESTSERAWEEPAEFYYEDAVQQVYGWLSEAEESIEHPALRERLAVIPEKLSHQRFSIGITGVMNAGKSTMLNALLGQEILGTSVVPETANLTLIKYAKEPEAIVNYWRESEWQQIEISGQTLEGIQAFVEETQAHLGEALGEYVTPEGRRESVTIESLPSYTSAEHSDKRCNLVKSVELYHDLEFVQNGVEIVDTPGLDDPVIQREEITKEYLLECDLLCHLMNVGQSATEKDISFILDTLLYRNVAQLLIVITRIDTVTQEELDEVIAYTKSSIQTTLEGLGKGREFASILERIDFIPIAGKMALLHRTGKAQEATDAGYDLERSGILEIETYLRDVLFGADSQKARLIIATAGKELLHLLHTQMESYGQEQALLGKSVEEIAQATHQYHEEIAQTQSAMQQLDEAIAQSREELVAYFDVLDTMAVNTLQKLQANLKRRIADDVSYALRKEKRKPAPERIATMIETGMQDGFIDLLREYRYGFHKRVEELMERLARLFEAFAVPQEYPMQDAKTFSEQHFGGLGIAQSPVILIEQVNRAIAKHGKQEHEQLDMALEEYFHEAIKRLGAKFQERAQGVQKGLLEDFEQRASEPLQRVRFEMESRQSLLHEAQRRAGDSSYDTQKRTRELLDKQAVLARVQAAITQGGML